MILENSAAEMRSWEDWYAAARLTAKNKRRINLTHRSDIIRIFMLPTMTHNFYFVNADGWDALYFRVNAPSGAKHVDYFLKSVYK